MEPQRPPGEAPGVQRTSGERPTPLARRIREPTDDERAEVAARQQQQREGDDVLPPLAAYSRYNHDRDSNSTGSTGSTERSEDQKQNENTIFKNSSASVQAKLAMDALERRDYELLALIAQTTATTSEEYSALDQPGGPRAPGTPTNPRGSAPPLHGNGQSRYGMDQRSGRSGNEVHQPTTRTGSRPESAPTHRRPAHRPPVRSAGYSASHYTAAPRSGVEYAGWGTPDSRYIDQEEFETIVQRTNEKLAAETLQMKKDLEHRIAQLESKSAWSEPGATFAPGSSSRAKTQALHGQRGLESEFDSVAAAVCDDARDKNMPVIASFVTADHQDNATNSDKEDQTIIYTHESREESAMNAQRKSLGQEDSPASDTNSGSGVEDALLDSAGAAGKQEVLSGDACEAMQLDVHQELKMMALQSDHIRLLEGTDEVASSVRSQGDDTVRSAADEEHDSPRWADKDEAKDLAPLIIATRVPSLHAADADLSVLRTKAHTFTSMFTLNTKCDYTDELQQRDMGNDFGFDTQEQEILKWRAMWYTPKALGYFPLSHPLRRRAIDLVENGWFDRFIHLTIAANCFQMAADDPCDTDPNSERRVLFDIFGNIFWGVFAFEAICKVIALGFCRGKGTYLKDSWNCLDFIIVTSGVLEFLSFTGSSSVVLRTFRLMRPLRALRAVGRFKDLRMLVELLLGCIPMLANVFALIAFILFVFGILGVQLFNQALRGRCFDIDTGLLNLETRQNVCTVSVEANDVPLKSGYKGFAGGFNPCPANEGCLMQYRNPFYGYVSFDNIGSAMLIIFQVMLQEDWTPIMYDTWDGLSWWTWTYFVVLNLVGPMFAIQLFLVVVASKYSDAKAEQAMIENAAVCLYEVKIGFISATINSVKFTTLDSYCKVHVDDKHKKTRVINNTVAPVWNEYFVFPVGAATSMADIYMYNWQRYGPHQLLGKLQVPVGTLDEHSEGTDKWYELVDGNGQAVEGGIRLRTQWRRKDTEDWVALPEIEDDDMYDEDDYEDEERSCLGWFQFYCEVIAYSDILMYTTIMVILFNVMVMAVDRDCDFIETPEYCRNFKGVLERINLFFTAFFTLELTIKMIGYTPLVYLKETANAFDVIIVVSSLIEFPLGLEMVHCYDSRTWDPGYCEKAGSGGGFSVLRSFRLVRVMRIGKLVRMFPQIQRQLKVISKTLSTVSSLVGLITLFLLIFAILGMNLFGNATMTELDAEDVDGVPFLRQGAFVRILRPGKPTINTARIMHVNRTSNVVRIHHLPGSQDDWEDVRLMRDLYPTQFAQTLEGLEETMIVGLAPRDGFDNFFGALLTVFQLLTTSDIGDVMYPAMRGVGEWTVVYFILITVIGNFMLFNLFVAIIITGFSENKADILKEEKENQVMMEQSLGRNQSLARGLSIKNPGGGGKDLISSTSLSGDVKSGVIDRFIKWFKTKVLGMDQVTAEDIKTLAGGDDKSQGSAAPSEAESVMLDDATWAELPWMRKVVENKYWNYFIIIFIVLSCVPLVLQRPGISSTELDLSRTINLMCNIVFIFEMLWKVTTYKWKKYIKSRWNQLDFFLVIISIIDMIGDLIRAVMGDHLDPSNPAFVVVGFLKNFRAFRALRPLRILSRAKGLKIVLGTLARAVGPVINTVVIALTAFFVAGIMSVQILGGRMMYCSDILIIDQVECVGVDPETGTTRMWLERQLQYSWIGDAMLSMFVLASQDNWEMHMYAGIDATSKGQGPIANNIPMTGIFFLAIMVIASFFVMQLFVGVFIDTFQTVTQEAKTLSKKQSLASETSSVTSATGNEEPISVYRGAVYTVVTTKQFDLIIAAFILGNIFTMAADSTKASSLQVNTLTIFEFVFNFVFGSEVIGKQWGMFPRQYFNSRWNKFDFVVVMVSYFGIAIDNLSAGITGGLNPTMLRILRIVRIFRILRAFRIFKAAQGLQNLVRTLLRSLTAVGNLAALLLLLFFVVGVLAVELFAELCIDSFAERNDQSPHMLDRCVLMNPSHLVDFHSSFANIGDALLTLFRISTSDNWSEIMTATVRQPGHRPDGSGYVQTAIDLLKLYNATGDKQFLVQAREVFSGCTTSKELAALSSIITCQYPDKDTGLCATTCGKSEILGYGIFTIFLCCSNFILLNLVMAVLMQELQNAIQSSQKKSSTGLNMLMSVSAATSKWIKIAEGPQTEHSDVISVNSALSGSKGTDSKSDVGDASSPMRGAGGRRGGQAVATRSQR